MCTRKRDWASTLQVHDRPPRTCSTSTAQDKHQLDGFFAEVLNHLITDQPPDPLQYIIDTALFGADYAKQVRTVQGTLGCARRGRQRCSSVQLRT